MSEKTRSMTEIVAKYLRKYPDFLIRHPEVLKEIQLPHASGEAVSLIEKQVEQLRMHNNNLTRQLNQLVQVATENEALMGRLHELTIELMLIGDLGTFFDRLSGALLDEFKADTLNITLLDRVVKAGKDTPLFSVSSDDPELKNFQTMMDKGETACGRLNRTKLDFLFGQRAQWVQSTAVVPLGQDGLLAVGSSDPARFYPGMGTLFLDLLAEVVKTRLAVPEPEQKRRTA